MKKDDIFLINEMIRNNPAAINELIKKYNLYVATIVSRILYGYSSQIDIQAVINEVFFLLWKNAKNINTEKSSDLKSYIGKIARNSAINEKRKCLQFESSLDDHLIGDTTKEYDQIELRDIIMNSLKQLKKNEQILLLKFYFQYKSISEISDELKLPQATVKTQLRRSREKLKKILIEGGYIYEA